MKVKNVPDHFCIAESAKSDWSGIFPHICLKYDICHFPMLGTAERNWRSDTKNAEMHFIPLMRPISNLNHNKTSSTPTTYQPTVIHGWIWDSNFQLAAVGQFTHHAWMLKIFPCKFKTFSVPKLPIYLTPWLHFFLIFLFLVFTFFWLYLVLQIKNFSMPKLDIY